MIRVIVDGTIYSQQRYGGISRCFTEMLSHLGNHQGELEIILHLPSECQGRGPSGEWIRTIQDIAVRPKRVLDDISKRATISYIRSLRPQIYHSTYYTLPYWPKLKSITTVHDFVHETYQALMGDRRRIVEQKKNAIEKADAVIAVSDSTKEDILIHTNVEESRIVVIHHGISGIFLSLSSSEEEIQAFKRKHQIGSSYWLFVGRRGLYKNFSTLLRAFVQVAKANDDYLIAVGGEDRLDPWQIDLLIRNRLERRVKLLHAASDADLKIAYSGAMAFVYPSLSEGFGIPLIEAMACGTPVIASDIPVFHEVAGNAAVYFRPNDYEVLADIMTGLRNTSSAKDIREYGKERAKSFSWRIASEKLYEVYRSI